MTLPFSIEAPYVMIPDSLAIHDEVMFTLCSIYSNCTQDQGCLVTTYVKAPITSLEWQTLNSRTVMRIEAGEDPPLLTHPWRPGLHSQEFGWTRRHGGRRRPLLKVENSLPAPHVQRKNNDIACSSPILWLPPAS